MNTALKTQLSRMVNDLHNRRTACYNVHTVKVTIGTKEYYGTTFEQLSDLTPGCRAYDEAKAKGEPLNYIRKRIILIGCIVKRGCKWKTIYEDTCFTFGTQEWGVACYCRDSGTEDHQQLRIGGDLITFQIMPWDLKGELIDRYEEEPYTRLPMTVEHVSIESE